jgi:hypothetical protein
MSWQARAIPQDLCLRIKAWEGQALFTVLHIERVHVRGDWHISFVTLTADGGPHKARKTKRCQNGRTCILQQASTPLATATCNLRWQHGPDNLQPHANLWAASVTNQLVRPSNAKHH